MSRKRKLQCITATISGKRVYCYGKTLSKASEKLERLKKQVKNGCCIRDSTLTLDRYFERWEKAREGSVRSATERTVRENYKRIASYMPDSSGVCLGNMPLYEIDRTMILGLQRDLSSRVQSATVNITTNLLKQVLNDALFDGIIDHNPCNGVRTLKRTEIPARDSFHRALTRDETSVFLENAKNSWYLNFYRFLLFSGLRCGEAAALTPADFKGDVIEIRRTVTRSISGHTVGADVKTGAGRRDIPLTPELKKIYFKQLYFRGGSTGLLFLSPEGCLILSTNVDSDIKKICRLSGIRPFTAHAFRDTFATRAIESGMNPKTLQEILGHSSYNITMTLYAHVMPSTKNKEMCSVCM